MGLTPEETRRADTDSGRALTHVLTAVHEAGHAAYGVVALGHGLTECWLDVYDPSGQGHHGSTRTDSSTASPRSLVLMGLMGNAAEEHLLGPRGMCERFNLPRINLTERRESRSPADHQLITANLPASGFGSEQEAYLAATDWVTGNWFRVVEHLSAVQQRCDCLSRLRTALRLPPAASGPPPATTPDSTPTAPAAPAAPEPALTTGGSSSMNIEEIRAAIAEAEQRGQTAAQQLLQVREDLQSMTQLLMQTTQGSHDVEVTEAVGQLQAVGDDLDQIPGRIHAATSTATTYAGRL